MIEFKISSPAFQNNSFIPDKFTCKGNDINPELDISGIPQNAKSMALIVDDPDAPSGIWVHWIAWNIPLVEKISENSILPTGAVQGITSAGTKGYHGPCPPYGTHRYFFKLYALDSKLELPKTSTKKELENAMNSHILGQAQLIGLYSKK